MTIDWWSLGLQALNVLILVWLLSRVFWRPVARAISKRQDAARAILDKAKAAQEKADATLAEVTRDREGIAAERETILAAATAAADSATKATLDETQDKAEKLVAAARLAIERDTDIARKENAAQATRLAVEIAAKLLTPLNTPEIQAAFLARLVEAIGRMSAADRSALAATTAGIDLVSASDLGDKDKEKITKAIGQALDASPKLTFVTDPDLIAGLELRTAHFVLHNSWQSDLAGILKDLKNAA